MAFKLRRRLEYRLINIDTYRQSLYQIQGAMKVNVVYGVMRLTNSNKLMTSTYRATGLYNAYAEDKQ